MPVVRYSPEFWLPDRGEIDNPGWLEVKNVLPYAGGWLVDARMTRRTIFASADGDTDVRGMAIHPANGSLGWLIYVGTDTEIFTVEPSGWAKTSRGSSYTPDSEVGWQFCPFGSNMIAVGGQSQQALVRVDDTGSFTGLVTNCQPDNVGFAKVWQVEDSSGTYVDITTDVNDFGASDAQCFPDVPQINDGIYFGRLTDVPGGLSIKVGVAGAGTYTIAWEYYNGAWTALSSVSDGTSGFGSTGVGAVTYTTPTDSVALALNGSDDLHWIRARISVFTNMTTIPKISQAGEHTAWPPQPKFVANWGDAVAMASFANVGPADEHGDPDNNGIWISDRTGRIFGSSVSHPGERTTYLSLTDEHGDITALWGGGEFGIVGKPRAIYRVLYGGTFRVDIRVASSAMGSIFPNGGVWANNHEFYLMTTAGPALMTQNGLQPIGVEQWQRTLFDTSWLIDTFAMNQDQSPRYFCYATYSRASDIVSWFFRSTADEMDVQFNFHRGSGRASVCERENMIVSGTSRGSRVLAAAAAPLAESTDWTGLKDVFVIAHDPTNANGDVAIFEPASAGTYKWVALPTFTSPFLELGRDPDQPHAGGPARAEIVWIRPLYSLNAGGPTAPTITAKVWAKQKTGEVVDGNHIWSQTTEDEAGRYMFPKAMGAYWNQIQIIYGNADGDNLENLAEVIERIDIGVRTRGALDA